MFKWEFLIIAVVVVLMVLGLGLLDSVNGSGVLNSPLLKDTKTLGLNLWFPKESSSSGQQVLGVNNDLSNLTASAALFVDTKTGQVLFEKNAHQRLPIASLTKVMTAVVALEYRNLDEKFSVSNAAAQMEPDKMSLIPGEKLTLKELLYGVFLLSANDGAETIAEDTTGDRSEFIKLMNDKAAELGMKDTMYVNPTGLDEDSGNSYSSAYDLATLARYAIRRYPVLVDISSTDHIDLPQTPDHQDYDMYSGINLLTTYPGVMGFKIGYTPEANFCIITLARKNGHEVVGVLLGSEDRRDEARTLLDYSFEKLN